MPAEGFNSALRKTEHLLWLGLLLTIALLMLAAVLAVIKTKSGATQALPVYGQVADFSLIDQNGRPVSLAELQGKVWIADIIFTRCAGPCPRMTRQMKSLQDAFAANANVRLVTLTTDPKFDTPPVLRRYAERYGADTNRWVFLTGTPEQIEKLATGSLKLAAVEKKPAERQNPEDLFIHSTIFVLVDKRARLRGIYETTGEGIDPERVQREILRGVRSLLRES